MKEHQEIQSIASFWNQESEHFDADHDTEDIALWKAELRRAAADGKKLKILDVGTGTGFLALLFAELGHEVTGIDIAEEMLANGRKKAEENGLSVNFIKGDGVHIPFEEGTFDLVVNCRVMWTLTDPVEALKEWMRVLKPGGTIVSYMRMMPMAKAETGGYYGADVILPLAGAGRDEYVQVYQEAGLKEIRTEELPAEMSHADMPAWTAFYGKRWEK